MICRRWLEWTFVLNSNIYCSIIFVNRIESAKFIKCLYEVQAARWDMSCGLELFWTEVSAA
jgi:hypothetical protein